MKRIVLTLGVLLCLLCVVRAQSMYGDRVKADVKMKYVYSFEEALKKAREVNKPIFVNWFADWAIPCHGMNQHVFSNEEFAKWMDEHFVNLLIDITSTEGRPWALKYDALMMAQYAVLNPNGDLIYKIVGGSPLPGFQKLLELSLNPKTTLPGMNERYENGERSLKFLRSYADVLKTAGLHDKKKQVIDELFAKVKSKDFSKKENWEYLTQKISGDDDVLFQNLLNNKAEYVKNVGENSVNQFIAGIYAAKLLPYVYGSTPYDAKAMADILMGLHKGNLPDTLGVFGLYDVAKFRGEKKYDKMLDIMRKGIQGCKQDFMMNLDITLGEIKGLSNADRKLLVGYLSERSKGLQAPLSNYYAQVIRTIENKEGIPFVDLKFDDALVQAKKEGKMLFLDCYTSWCGPCKMMSEQVFPLKVVGDYFKKHFVALKIDMEKGEGPALQKRLGVEAFPTMFVFDGDGKELLKLRGARDVETFLKELKEVCGE